MGGTPQTIVTNFVNALWQDMLEKTPDEFLGADGHGFDISTTFGILIPKSNLTIVDRKDSAVGDGCTVNVAGQIIKDCTSAMDGRFTVDNPVFSPYGLRKVNILELPANTCKEDTAKQLR